MRRGLFVVCLIDFPIDRDSQIDFAGRAMQSRWQRNGPSRWQERPGPEHQQRKDRYDVRGNPISIDAHWLHRPPGPVGHSARAMIMTNLVHEISNHAIGVQVRVWLIAGRYHVTLVDLDAEQMVPAVVIFDERANAIAYAQRCAA